MIHPTSASAIKAIRAVAQSNFVDLASGSQSIEDWGKEVVRTYHRGKRRPELMVLVIERWGECYQGEIWITEEDFGETTKPKG